MTDVSQNYIHRKPIAALSWAVETKCWGCEVKSSSPSLCLHLLFYCICEETRLCWFSGELSHLLQIQQTCLVFFLRIGVKRCLSIRVTTVVVVWSVCIELITEQLGNSHKRHTLYPGNALQPFFVFVFLAHFETVQAELDYGRPPWSPLCVENSVKVHFYTQLHSLAFVLQPKPLHYFIQLKL